MIVYHVCGPKKFKRYCDLGFIMKPVRAWKDIKDAERFSIQTGRPIILRLKLPNKTPLLDGHKNKAVVLNKDYNIPQTLKLKK